MTDALTGLKGDKGIEEDVIMIRNVEEKKDV